MPVAWKLVPAPSPPLYANPGSDHARRGKFATKTLWVTPHSEAERYPAGIYPLEPNPVGIEQWTSMVRSRPVWSQQYGGYMGKSQYALLHLDSCSVSKQPYNSAACTLS